jgi:hypothetical protein
MVIYNKQLQKRAGIAMIELIFALVIMGIVLMSAPMLIQQSIKSGNVALQQEAIVAAASQTAIILSMPWDENNNSNSAGIGRILDVDREPFDFDTALNGGPRGHQGVRGERSAFLASGLENKAISASNTFGNPDDGEGTFDDIDDYHNQTTRLILLDAENTTADVGDYVDVNLTMSTLINYTEDRITTGDINVLSNASGTIALTNKLSPTSLGVNTNIKFIQVTLTSDSGVDELNKSIILNAFSCNIGTTLPQGSIEL